MKDTDYVYAVARIRVHELSLLTQTDLQAIASAKSYEEAAQMIADKGYMPVEGNHFEDSLKERMQQAWALLKEILPEGSEEDFRFLTLKNDYQNIKLLIKSVLRGEKAEEYFLTPNSIPFDTLKEVARKKEVDLLPEGMRDDVLRAYQALAYEEDGQMCEVILDRSFLKEMTNVTENSPYEGIREYGEAFVAFANLKTAIRAARTQKGKTVVANALADCATLDREALEEAVSEGTDAVMEYIKETPYKEGLAALEESLFSFEKWCNNYLMDILRPAKHEPFGALPIAAYILALEAEVTSLRIILSGKQIGISGDILKERVLDLYV